MTRILTDNTHHALSLDATAVFATWFDGGRHFHDAGVGSLEGVEGSEGVGGGVGGLCAATA
jgi:hypothetical protein